MKPAAKPAPSACGAPVEQVGRVELLEHRRVADRGHGRSVASERSHARKAGCQVPDRRTVVGALEALLPPPRRLDRLAPARRHQTRRQVGERRQDEEPIAGLGMRHFEELRGLRRVDVGVERASLGRPFDGQARPTEDQQVESSSRGPQRSPRRRPNARSSVLERGQQRERPGRRVRAGRDVEGDDGVPEVGLVRDADRAGRVQPRDAAEPDAGQRRQRRDRAAERRARRRRGSHRGRCRRGPRRAARLTSLVGD